MKSLFVWITTVLLVAGCGSATAPAASSRPASSASQAPSVSAPAVKSPSAAHPGSLRKASLRLDFKLAGYHAPYFYALEKGFYRQAGIDLTIGAGQGSVTTAEVVANGSDTFGLVDGGAMMPLVAKGLKIRMVMDLIQKNATAILSLAKTGIHGPKDLIGKKIAFYPGGSGPVLLKAFLAATHLKASQMDLVSATPQDGHALLLDGKVDGLLGYSYTDVPTLEAKGGPTNALLFVKYGVEVPEHGIVVSLSTLARRPGLVRAFVKATQEGFDAARKHPKAAVAALIKANPHTPLNPTLALQQLMLSLQLLHTQNTQGKPIGWMSAADWRTGQALLVKYGLIKHPESNVGVYFTDKYLPQQG